MGKAEEEGRTKDDDGLGRETVPRACGESKKRREVDALRGQS